MAEISEPPSHQKRSSNKTTSKPKRTRSSDNDHRCHERSRTYLGDGGGSSSSGRNSRNSQRPHSSRSQTSMSHKNLSRSRQELKVHPKRSSSMDLVKQGGSTRISERQSRGGGGGSGSKKREGRTSMSKSGRSLESKPTKATPRRRTSLPSKHPDGITRTVSDTLVEPKKKRKESARRTKSTEESSVRLIHRRHQEGKKTNSNNKHKHRSSKKSRTTTTERMKENSRKRSTSVPVTPIIEVKQQEEFCGVEELACRKESLLSNFRTFLTTPRAPSTRRVMSSMKLPSNTKLPSLEDDDENPFKTPRTTPKRTLSADLPPPLVRKESEERRAMYKGFTNAVISTPRALRKQLSFTWTTTPKSPPEKNDNSKGKTNIIALPRPVDISIHDSSLDESLENAIRKTHQVWDSSDLRHELSRRMIHPSKTSADYRRRRMSMPSKYSSLSSSLPSRPSVVTGLKVSSTEVENSKSKGIKGSASQNGSSKRREDENLTANDLGYECMEQVDDGKQSQNFSNHDDLKPGEIKQTGIVRRRGSMKEYYKSRISKDGETPLLIEESFVKQRRRQSMTTMYSASAIEA